MSQGESLRYCTEHISDVLVHPRGKEAGELTHELPSVTGGGLLPGG